MVFLCQFIIKSGFFGRNCKKICVQARFKKYKANVCYGVCIWLLVVSVVFCVYILVETIEKCNIIRGISIEKIGIEDG